MIIKVCLRIITCRLNKKNNNKINNNYLSYDLLKFFYMLKVSKILKY